MWITKNGRKVWVDHEGTGAQYRSHEEDIKKLNERIEQSNTKVIPQKRQNTPEESMLKMLLQRHEISYAEYRKRIEKTQDQYQRGNK